MSRQCLCSSFLRELLTGTHDFSVAGDVFKLALFTSQASLDTSTTAYASTNEVSGGNYTAGGASLTNVAPATSGITAFCDFSDATWTALTVSGIRYGLIYNSTEANKAVAVLDFGRDISKTAEDFTVTFPPADSSSAIIRIQGN